MALLKVEERECFVEGHRILSTSDTKGRFSGKDLASLSLSIRLSAQTKNMSPSPPLPFLSSAPPLPASSTTVTCPNPLARLHYSSSCYIIPAELLRSGGIFLIYGLYIVCKVLPISQIQFVNWTQQ